MNERCIVRSPAYYCYTLYGSEQSQFTWQQANEQCHLQPDSTDSKLLMINNTQIQDIVTNILSYVVGQSQTTRVWTAGRRKSDTSWIYVTGDPVQTGKHWLA